MDVTVFATGIVELEARAAGKPDGGDACLVERRSEFIEAGSRLSAYGDQGINSDIENTRRLAHAKLRNSGDDSIGIPLTTSADRQKKAGRSICPPATVPGEFSRASLSVFTCQTSLLRRLPANSPWGC